MRKRRPTDAEGHLQDWSVNEPIRTLDQYLEGRREDMHKQFPPDTGVDRESLIRAYQAIHWAKRYPHGIPDNVLTPDRVLSILNGEGHS